ncbi:MULTISPECIES: HdeD family acid-resistance protein [Legionella]|uniref:HdeD family acid-resistance protein n=1 Tax=Legionella septentrionalis TaxID=2498109 RepID=A0A433JL68_9GAMM|nr:MULTISPECIES: HdeD family acid-resistance protein [Legionella]MCP0914556.1 HdeD family acid-resistance protein [Legionella sp. 27cVA30]RUQ90021.1 HdeD family acid-resistance protein [Legionella septentrionalis]RUQ93494.1 HdeD family acid-resistance protein [Legionella septentrionalis]RUR11203.1 HdeD family acid-resistance protein [Legionella septentrionalis]RUR14382.1 HdeD family acid-resistance protein [Legionella septentrionalis]
MTVKTTKIPAGLQRSWGWLLGLGILFVLLGAIGLGMVVGLTLASVLVLGVLLIIAGVMQIIDAFKCRDWNGVLWHALIGVLYIVGGGIIVYDPIFASTVLTALIAAVLIVIGTIRVIMALALRHSRGWGWLLLAGLIAVLLGILILMQWPWSGFWVIGLFVAVDLMISGWTYIFMALALKRV